MRAIRSVTFVSSLLLGHPNNQHIMVSTRSMVRPANVRLAAATRGTSEGEEEPAKKKKPRSPRKKSEPEPVVDDGLHRCPWAGYEEVDYHDKEWGRPVYDDVKLFEFITLEGAQAGLSWRTILRKRENYREAFAGFDPCVVAQFGPDKVIWLHSLRMHPTLDVLSPPGICSTGGRTHAGLGCHTPPRKNRKHHNQCEACS
mmetsp:Transcript_39151/g.155198  ORF Transcript_39151/g.155198 Transcript_39151/m.155198 type:complete len:200 (+) Transcript_39151:2487-3086(+)